jgi:hypothetical protein
MVNASEITWCDLLFLILATKPMPHESCSKAGEYNPLRAIMEKFHFRLDCMASNQIENTKKCD